ncbi:toxin-antitoxin system YwqK family antitoxin [Chitinophaga solisilvae]|uniref:Uncharacterized protein n=1 Tax=Chitinophaga solisilvae TaxID=1233460 RepID=A0A3S1AVB4_9BACT|nr:hypothetical protein [Chitinophaga solisilvae]NSL87438.1 hypothetical protein [Chitinophaga solisilvae]
MQKLFLCILLQLGCVAVMAQGKTNQRDAQGRKQGNWVEVVEELRGEPGFTWEGAYKNGRKEGMWKKTSLGGNIMAEENFRNNVLDGYCKYFYPNGKRSEEGSFLATEIEGQRDTVMVVDPVTQAEKPVVITRLGNSVRNGVWKLYDEETGKMVKSYYKRGELVTPEELGDSTEVSKPAPAPAPLQLPHEDAGKRKRKG